MSEYRVIFSGGRNFVDSEAVKLLVDGLPDNACVIHGDAKGADTLVDHWAEARGLPVELFPADWLMWGKAAGPKRNQEMVDAGADLLIAFPGGRGTADCVRRAREAGIRVKEVLIS